MHISMGYDVIVRTGTIIKQEDKAMAEYTLKTFNIDGKDYKFDTDTFEMAFKTYAKANNKKLGELVVEISDKIGVTSEAIRNWRRGINGPVYESYIDALERKFGLTKGRLLKEVKGEKKMQKLNDRQVTATKKVYDKFVEFLDEFKVTDGFNITYSDFKAKGAKDPLSATYDYLEKKQNEILLVLDQEYFDLRGTELLNELYEYAYDDLVDIYNEKISDSYRIAASVDGEGVTTNDDYCDAMAKLNSILEKYL